MDHYKKAAYQLRQSRYAIVLTGAGISVESGIPDFRSEEGLWSKYDPMEFGHILSFQSDPAKVWGMLLEMDQLLTEAEPNPAHYALAHLEEQGIVRVVVTQNVDSLHQRAGSRRVVEYHGHNRTLTCNECRQRFSRETVSLENLPPLCGCGGPLRPDYVFFGEDIPRQAYQEAQAAAHDCDLIMVVGTSATVAPASYLPLIAKKRGAFVLEINPSKTDLTFQLTDLHIAESAGKALPAIIDALNKTGPQGE